MKWTVRIETKKLILRHIAGVKAALYDVDGVDTLQAAVSLQCQRRSRIDKFDNLGNFINWFI